MPGGLPGVEQRFDADASGYVAAITEMIRANKDLIDSIGEARRKLGDVAGGAEDVGRVNAAIRDQLQTFRDMSSVMGEAIRANKEFNTAQAETVRLSRDGQDALRGLMGAHGMLRETATAAQKDIAKSFTEQLDPLDRMVTKLGVAKDAYAGLGDASKPLAYSADNARLLNQVLDNTRVSADGATRALAGHAAAAALSAAAAGRIIGGGGGGGGGWAAAAAAAAGPPGGGWDKGTAGSMWGTVGTFLGTWLPRAHYVLMAANELAATLGPATVAAGMGALVGMQGGEQALPRLKAVFATGESLGGSLGMTQGQYMGLKTPALQNAQDLATGAAFEGIGAMTNILRSGAGGAFIQLGSNTVSMWSRMMANLTTEFKGGMGDQLGGLVSGGTGYLSQFGKIFGNLGHLFLNTAPNLPGVGGDYLSTLQGLTGGLAGVTGFLGPALGPILAAEAAGRVGTPLVGGVGRLLGRAGTGVAGVGDFLAANTEGFGAGTISKLVGRGGVGLAEAGGFLGALTAPEIAVAGGMAYMLGKGMTYQTPGQQWAGGLVSQVNQAGLAQSMPMAIADMQKLAGVKGPDYPTSGWQGAVYQDLNNLFTTGRGLAQGHPGALVTGTEAGIKGLWDEAFGGKTLPSNVQAANAAINQLSQGMVNAFGAGAQVSDQWKKLGGGAVDMGKAFDIATMAQLQLGSSFEKNGKLTAQSKQMIANLYAGYQPMNMNTGQFGAAVGAQTAMSGLQHTQIAAVNQAYDQMAQMVQGGAADASTFFGMLGGTPTASTKSKSAGIALTPPPAFAGFAKALGSFTSASGAAAWNTLTNASSGMLPAMGQQLDWLRTMQTMGALGPGQTTSMAGFDIAQMLPVVGKNPAALAMLSNYAQQFGGPSFAPGASGASMSKSLQGWVKQNGLTTGGYNALMTTATERSANIGTDAQQFVQQIGSGIGGALAQGIATHGAQLQDAFMNVAGHKGTAAALGKYDTFLAGSGVPLKGMQDMVTYAAKLSGAGPQQINAMMAQVKKDYDIYIKTHADTSGLQQIAKGVTSLPKTKTLNINATANPGAVNHLKQLVDSTHSKTVNITALAPLNAVQAVQAAISAVHGKTVTITVDQVFNVTRNVVTDMSGMVLPYTPAGAAANLTMSGLLTRHAAGTLVPGAGSGDHVPALLEPGEAVVPRYLVPLIAPILKSHHVPGFAAGGIAGNPVYQHLPEAQYLVMRKEWDDYKAQMKADHQYYLSYSKWAAQQEAHGNFGKTGTHPAAHQAAQQTLAQLLAELNKTGAWKQVSVSIIHGLAGGIKNAGPEAAAAAKALTSKITTEMNYARGVSGAAISGLNLGGIDTTQTTVGQSMTDYLTSIKGFTGDLKTLTKGGLSKDIMKQLISAGPVQGDLLAQSILQGGGTSGTGISQVNKLWSQIGVASHALGAQAGMSIYGGTLAPNLKSGTFTSNNVTVNINAPGGASGNLGLTPAQIKAITEEIQAKLLQQAKRNRRTGLKLPGYGA